MESKNSMRSAIFPVETSPFIRILKKQVSSLWSLQELAFLFVPKTIPITMGFLTIQKMTWGWIQQTKILTMMTVWRLSTSDGRTDANKRSYTSRTEKEVHFAKAALLKIVTLCSVQFGQRDYPFPSDSLSHGRDGASDEGNDEGDHEEQ